MSFNYSQPFLTWASGGLQTVNGAVVGGGGDIQSSMYESFQALTNVQVSHFVEWFSGSDIGGYWTTRNIAGTGTFAMEDAVDGGFYIQAGANDNDQSAIDFNNKRHYDHQNSVSIHVWAKAVTDSLIRVGLMDGTGAPVSESRAFAHVSTTGYYNCETGSGSAASTTASSIAIDTATYHSHKLDSGSSNVKYYIDGVLEVTKTTNLPTVKLSPRVMIKATEPAASAKVNIRYLETYNTSVSPSSSLYERLSALTQVAGQRVVENFSGAGLQTDRWTTTDIQGTGTFAMVDAVDEGFSITTSGATNDRSTISFNDKRQYAHDGSVYIAVTKNISTSNQATYFGHRNDLTGGNDYALAEGNDLQNSGNYGLITKDATTASRSGSSTAIDTSWHNHKLDLGSANVKYYIDGVLEVTKTTNRPTAKGQPVFLAQTQTTATKEGRIRYLEAYNKLGTEADYSSVYQMFDALTTVRKSHFWEWFDGDGIDTTRWTETLTGSSSGAMNDAVDGGFQITSGAVSGNRAEYDFNNKRQYDYQNSEFICVMKANSTSSIFIRCGFLDDVLASFTNAAYWRFDTNASIYYNLATQGSATDSDVTADTNYHSFKGTVTSSDFKGYIDGVLKVTITTNLPAAKYQPHIDVGTRTSSAKTGNFTYFESWNT